jgi:hypothetical protein
MGNEINENATDVAAKPIHADDVIDSDNTDDGGATFNASKKIKISELTAYLSNVLGVSITNDSIAIGTGTGIEASTVAIKDLDVDGSFYMGHEDQVTSSNYLIYHNKVTGDSWLNGATEINFTIGGSPIHMLISDGLIQMLNGPATQSMQVGNSIGSPTDSKMYVKAGSQDYILDMTNTSETPLFRFKKDGFFNFLLGTSINEISIDGTLADDSDDAVPTEKAVKTYVDGLVAPQIIGGVTLSSSSNTNILNGTYVILADTTTVTSVTSGIGQDSNWTLEVTQAGITNQKGVVTFTGNLEKNAGGGVNYDIAIFKNGSIVSESEQIDQKLESGGKGQSVTVMAITEFSTNDTFDIRVAGNGTADDIFCGGGSLYIQ